MVPWEAGGTTDIGNAVAKCRRCHLEHHRKKWTDRLDPDGTYTVTTNDRRRLTTRPRNLENPVPRLPVATTAEPAPAPRTGRSTSRPHCDCRCEEHRSPEEEAEFRHDRALVLERVRRHKLGLGA